MIWYEQPVLKHLPQSLLVLGIAACGGTQTGTDAGSQDAAAVDAGMLDAGSADAQVDAGPQRPQALSQVEGYLIGDFDNQAQYDTGFPQLVERHVCKLAGVVEDPEVLWLYVEHVEHVAQGRDAYFIRVNEIRMQGQTPVSKAYRFPAGHTLRTNAFAFNGARDACFDASLIGDLMLEQLEYRSGCDVTFTATTADRFSAVSGEGTCMFPGGWIQTISEVWADGLDSTDRAVTTGGSETGATFEFRRVDNFMPPG